MRNPGLRPVYGYVSLVCLVGGGLFMTLFDPNDVGALTSPKYLLFAAFLAFGELLPIKVPRKGEEDEITTSTTFAYAILLSEGPFPAVLAQVVASLAADLVHRKPLWKAGFNAAQYTIAIAACAGVLRVVTDLPLDGGGFDIEPSHLPAILLAGAVMFLVNTTLTGTALALAQDLPILSYVRRDILFQASTDGVLVALAPMVLIAADWSLAILPLLALPLVAVHRSARTSVENVRLVGQLEGSLGELTKLNRLKDDFVASVSHELRTPLTVMRGFVKTLLGDDAMFSQAEQRSFLEAIDRNSERLHQLIERLLVMARLESDRITLRVSTVSLQETVSRIVEQLKEPGRGHVFDVAWEEGPVEAETDELVVTQVLSNLMENAVKYSPAGTTVSVRASREDGWITVSVEDRGAGVPPEHHDRIFDRFYQVEPSSTRGVGGAGLGLYISRRLAEELGGRVWLDRSGREGSVFCFTLPISLAAGERPADEESLGA